MRPFILAGAILACVGRPYAAHAAPKVNEAQLDIIIQSIEYFRQICRDNTGCGLLAVNTARAAFAGIYPLTATSNFSALRKTGDPELEVLGKNLDYLVSCIAYWDDPKKDRKIANEYCAKKASYRVLDSVKRMKASLHQRPRG